MDTVKTPRFCLAFHARLARMSALCLGVAALLLAPRAAAAHATYTYTGHPFTLFSCGPTADNSATLDCTTPAPANSFTSYDTTDFVTATLVFDDPLGPNFPYGPIAGIPGFQLTLNDGQHTLSTPLSPGAGLIAEASTDATGQIDHWRLVINSGGTLNGGIGTINFTDGAGVHMFDQGVLACCDPTLSGDLALVLGSPGTWSNGAPTPSALISSLMNIVTDPLLGLNTGQMNSLLDKLSDAQASVLAGQYKQAVNQLNALLQSVASSVKTHKISAQTGAMLTGAASAILTLLG
jgi:hypothetical protein